MGRVLKKRRQVGASTIDAPRNFKVHQTSNIYALFGAHPRTNTRHSRPKRRTNTVRNAPNQNSGLVLHRRYAGGHSTAKVFKGWVIKLAPGQTRLLEKQHPIKPIPSRRHHVGKPAVDVRINAAVQAQAALELTRGSDQPARETCMP